MKSGYKACFSNHYAENKFYKYNISDIVFIGSKYDKYPLSQFRDNIIDNLFNLSEKISRGFASGLFIYRYFLTMNM